MRQSFSLRFRFLAVLGVVAAMSGGTAAQTANIPDFTGVWTNYQPPGGRAGGGRGAAPAAPAAGRGAAPAGGGAAAPARGGGGGGRGGGVTLPMTEVAKQKVAAYRALVSPGGETPGGYCLGSGMPGSMLGSGGYPMEILQRPEQIIIVYEAHAEIRRIYFGNRNMAPEDRIPGRNGYSSGRWEGDTLVVETTNLIEQVDQQYAHSDQAKIVERYRMTEENGRKVLTAQMTMTDPVFYTQPVTAEKRWSQVPNGHVLPYECAEENWNKRLEELEKKAAKPASSK
jgi:hypothetical protein